MYQNSEPLILRKEELSQNVFRIRLQAPLIASEHQAGQFILLSVNLDFGERIPLTITDSSAEEGWIDLIFQRVGKTTNMLADCQPGDKLPVLVGPLGEPTKIKLYGRVVCVGGGIGAAPLYPMVKALKKAGNHVTVIDGARTRELLILEEDFRAAADEVIVCTDDGSQGQKAVVTVPLKEKCQSEEKPDLVICAGPPIMMKFCAETTRPFGIPTIASLNTIMIDGTGMCGGCRITVGGKTKFVCVDGPEFDAHQVDFDNMMLRLGTYKPQEKLALENHICRIGLK